jgi:hypothetical protein
MSGDGDAVAPGAWPSSRVGGKVTRTHSALDQWCYCGLFGRPGSDSLPKAILFEYLGQTLKIRESLHRIRIDYFFGF